MIQMISTAALYSGNKLFLYTTVVFIAAYAVGNINPAIIFGWINHVDIRKEGSGNAGMTNTIRVLGLGWGIAVFAVDILKAYISVKVAMNLPAGDADSGLLLGMAAFAGVVIGHCYPALYGFKGGKGVASSLGGALALNWQSALSAAAVAAVVFLVSGKRMSVASIVAVITYPVFVYLFTHDLRLLIFSIAAVLFLIIQHAANISRIAKGEEKALTIGHKGQMDNSAEGLSDRSEKEEGTEE